MGGDSTGRGDWGEPDPALERAYREAVYALRIGDTEVTFRVGEGVPGVSETFALVTAFNPGHERPAQEVNEARNAALLGEIEARGWPWLPAEGRSADGAHREPSFAVFGIAFAEAVALGQQFGQAAICWYDGEVVRLAWC